MQELTCHKIYSVVEECTLCCVEWVSIEPQGYSSKKFKYLHVVQSYVIFKTVFPV